VRTAVLVVPVVVLWEQMDNQLQAVQVLQVKDLRVEIHPVHSRQLAAVAQLKQVALVLGIPAAQVEMVHQLIHHGD
jgi:hypothetical protein